MENPLVSVIIPTFNRSHLIEETLDSVLAQTYTNWECIVVDDGSTDPTSKILEKYLIGDSRIKYYQRPENKPKGANACRNYGFELSKGKYVNWFDSDDLMLPEKLEIQVKELNSPIYDFTICQTIMYDVVLNKEKGLRAQKLTSENIFEDYILFEIFWLTGAPLWRRSFLDKNNLSFNEELHQAQDYDFHIRVLSISQNYFSNSTPYVIFKIHSSNMSHSLYDSSKKIKSNVHVKNMILEKYHDKLGDITLKKTYKDLLVLYNFCLLNDKMEIAFLIFKYLVMRTIVLKLDIRSNLNLVIRLFASFLSFLFFSKGEKLLKYKI